MLQLALPLVWVSQEVACLELQLRRAQLLRSAPLQALVDCLELVQAAALAVPLVHLHKVDCLEPAAREVPLEPAVLAVPLEHLKVKVDSEVLVLRVQEVACLGLRAALVAPLARARAHSEQQELSECSSRKVDCLAPLQALAVPSEHLKAKAVSEPLACKQVEPWAKQALLVEVAPSASLPGGLVAATQWKPSEIRSLQSTGSSMLPSLVRSSLC